MGDILSVSNVSKAFGTQEIIKDLSFSIPEHSIYGFIGKNGAGKTTTMKLILGLYQTDKGEIRVNGEKVTYGQTNTNRFIGYLPDVPEFYDFMTPTEYLFLCGEITGLKKEESHGRIRELLAMVGLENSNKRIQGFSRGMKQRLGIAQALLNQPKLLICDEPTSALDPGGRKEILDILHSVKSKTTILFSTHILSDLERICDNIGVLHEGKLALSGSLEQIKSRHSSEGFEVEFATWEDAEKIMEKKFIEILKNDAERKSKTLVSFKTRDQKAIGKVMKVLVENEIQPIRIERLEPTLESLFLEVTKV